VLQLLVGNRQQYRKQNKQSSTQFLFSFDSGFGFGFGFGFLLTTPIIHSFFSGFETPAHTMLRVSTDKRMDRFVDLVDGSGDQKTKFISAIRVSHHEQSSLLAFGFERIIHIHSFSGQNLPRGAMLAFQ
jgi:hypothetical protein